MTDPRPQRRFRPAIAARVGSVILLWLVMMGWLIRFEACPQSFTGRIAGYKDLFRSGVLVRSSWMRITANGSPVGFSHTEIDVNEKDPKEHNTIDSEMDLELNILGRPQKVYTRMIVSLDILSRLQKFDFTLNSESYETRITGIRVKGDQFLTTIRSGGQAHRDTLTIPDDVILQSPLLEQALGAMEPGQTRVFKTLDPASMAVSDVHVKAERRETLTVRGKAEETTVLLADYQGMTVTSWINREGEILRQETPLGWSMEACLPEEALAYRRKVRDGQPAELLASAAAKSDKPLPDARRLVKLDVRLKGVDIPPGELATDRQAVLESDTNGVRLVITAAPWPDGDIPEDPAAFSNELAATAFIQSDDPDIRSKADEITRGLTGRMAAARAINDWVFTHMEKTPAASLPSAAAVLRNLQGDCNEHTYLTVALARAAGIPAKVKAGVVYMDGGFYYHAWAGIRAGGRWVEMDPTFGQPVADATHIALAEGELAGQAGLLRYIGRLSVGILSFEKEVAP